MKSATKKVLAVAVVAALSAPMAAMATNGYFAHGYGTKNKGLAGGGVALPQDAMIAATNPAGMVFVGNRMDVGAAIFSPSPRSYTVTGAAPMPPPAFGLVPGTVESVNDYFLIPHFARNWMLDADSSIGVSVYGNGGMNTEYTGSGPGTGPFYGGTAGVNLEQLFIATTYARKISNTASWGVTPIVVYQRFEAQGLGAFAGFSTDAANLTDMGTDTSTGFGLKLGVQGDVASGVTLAASYQSKMSMSKFEKYAGLFAEGGDFDIPATATVGIAWAPSAGSAVTADIQKIYYSGVAAISNPISNLTMGCGMGDMTQCLGGANGAGFGWEDMTIIKLGYQMETGNGWTWRAGYSKGDQPIPDTEVMFNILAPGVMEKTFTFGFTKEVGTNNEFNFAAMYAPRASLKGVNPMQSNQMIELEMTQWELEGSWAVKF